MNFLPAKADGGGALRALARRQRAIAAAGGAAAGRGGHGRHPARAPAIPSAPDGADRRRARCEMVEQLGADTLVHVAHGADTVIARLPHGHACRSRLDAAPCRADPARVFLFDSDDGRAACNDHLRDPGPIRACARIAAPASSRPRTRSRRCASATRTATRWPSSTSSSPPTASRSCCTTRRSSARRAAAGAPMRCRGASCRASTPAAGIRRSTRASCSRRLPRSRAGRARTACSATSRSSPRRAASARPAPRSRSMPRRCGAMPKCRRCCRRSPKPRSTARATPCPRCRARCSLDEAARRLARAPRAPRLRRARRRPQAA